MAKTHPEIDAALADWIAAQPLFFNATAPLSAEGHVNLSPRGLDSFRVLGPREVAYLDITGSGNESAAHLAENGRITIMFCAFSGKPQILRLYGRGYVVRPDEEGWAPLRSRFAKGIPGIRQIVRIDVERIQTSCGYGVPLMAFEAQRSKLLDWATKKGEAGIIEYQRNNNSESIDGLKAPGIQPD
jgi:hypothetical protein